MSTFAFILMFGCLSANALNSNAHGIQANQVSFHHSSHTSCLASIFRFTPKVADFSSGCVESTEITLSNLAWKVVLCKRPASPTNATEVVDLFLQSSSNSNSSWSCAAEATIKLLGQDRILVRNLEKRNYKNTNSANGITELISWDDFRSNYVDDNEQANFDIELSTNGAIYNAPTDVNQKVARVQVLLNNVSSLGEFNSTKVIAQGVNWKVRVQKRDYYLAVYLEADEDNFSMGTSYNVTAIFKLLSFDITKKPLTQTFIHTYRWGSTEKGFEEFLYWDDFIISANKYVVQNKAHLLVQFTVNDPKSLWDVEGNDISKTQKTLSCSVCKKEFGSGNILAHTQCGTLYCNNCFHKKLTQYKCATCHNIIRNTDHHPIHF